MDVLNCAKCGNTTRTGRRMVAAFDRRFANPAYLGMATSVDPSTRQPASPDLDAFEHHWQDEADAAYLCRLLSEAEPDVSKKDLYRRLAEVEDKHVHIWADLLRQYGRQPGAFSPTGRTRLLAG